MALGAASDCRGIVELRLDNGREAAADETEQARYMEALFGTFAREPWCLGFHWWKWDQHSPAKGWRGPKGLARDFTFKGKEAESVFRAWAGGSQ